MPELPEVETTRRGIAPHVEGRSIRGTVVRQPRLRWPVPVATLHHLTGYPIERVERRAKYLLLRTPGDTLMLHLGMSGSLRVVEATTPAETHDHFDLLLEGGAALRLRDPRRFGSIHCFAPEQGEPALLARLGPEPLSAAFNGDYLYERARGRRRAVKDFLMDARIVVGVGNIYAAEALHAAGIHPDRAAGRVGRARYRRLAAAVQRTLEAAIDQGGTTLRDFTDAAGAPGYFRIALAVYGRAGEPCRTCERALRAARRGQRATVYCPRCQT
jgi:formamidopyrimidine-DNA glycosylase